MCKSFPSFPRQFNKNKYNDKGTTVENNVE